jgi:hypothetical protein
MHAPRYAIIVFRSHYARDVQRLRLRRRFFFAAKGVDALQ